MLTRPVLEPDGGVPSGFYDYDYWERGAESGKMSYNTNIHPLETCKAWAEDTYKRWGPFKSYLELGCGRGWAIYGMLNIDHKFDELIGVDVSRYAVDTAPEDVKPFLRCQSATDLSFLDDRSIDLIFSNDFLEHLTEVQIYGVLAECRRVGDRIVHLVSVGENVDVPWGEILPDSDQSHITMKSIGWWAQRFLNVFDDASSWEVVVRRHGRTVEFDAGRVQ